MEVPYSCAVASISISESFQQEITAAAEWRENEHMAGEAVCSRVLLNLIAQLHARMRH